MAVGCAIWFQGLIEPYRVLRACSECGIITRTHYVSGKCRRCNEPERRVKVYIDI